MRLHEIFDRDPRTARLANNGQARITEQVDDQATLELRAELETFVCEGEFARAVQIILEQFLGNLGHTKQDSAWVSGFFGSGKSHLLKMLAHLWVDTPFTGGATARTLVRGGLSDEIQAHLRELDTQVRRTGLPAVAAAGTLLGGTRGRVREDVLRIVLRGAGWPAQYPQAMFCFWLREQGWLDAVRGEVESAGRDWLRELNNLYVSLHIHGAVWRADRGLATDEQGVGAVLRSQFPQLTADIGTEEFAEAVRLALGDNGAMPLTLLVLDEVQQYIGGDGGRAAIIVEVVEALQTQFSSRVMLVAAGQSALAAETTSLAWLKDRFAITRQLSDADVHTVVRKVLLAKKPSAEPEIRSTIRQSAGEISRHLRETRICERSDDHEQHIVDYPLLPIRRRFWEECFRAVDAAGTQSALRSQLRILHDVLQDSAERPLGFVTPAAALYNALAPNLVRTGVLLGELHARIQTLDDGTDIGILRRDLCGLVFLIGKLPRQTGVDLGIRANATILADLMVEDVTKDSGPFRKRVADVLEDLAEAGTLMKLGDAYRLQTTEGAEWDRAFRERQASVNQNEMEIATVRDQLLGDAVRKRVSEVRLQHGSSKLRRIVVVHSGDQAPTLAGDQVIVWLRDGWTSSEQAVEASARERGHDDPTLYVFLPRKHADDFRRRIADVAAAEQVLALRGAPSTPEGIEARESMTSRLRGAQDACDAIVSDVVGSARVLQGGGAEVFADTLTAKVQSGAASSLARLFPRFDDGDHAMWDRALKRARDGADDPLKAVGWEQPTEDHPVAKGVLAKVGAGARGSDVQKALTATPYGWPQDAIDAVLIALLQGEHLRATRNGQPVAAGSLDQAGVKATEFRRETVHLSTQDRIDLRGLYQSAGVKVKAGEEQAGALAFLSALRELALSAGGEAPMPARPDSAILDELSGLTGSEQLAAILERR
ncbi:BREX system P-loop protein BrxC, partial [Candidatus Poribacteria bacterium]|nr:BREX system P-loop protein BrxC [Candidatus Poribacteria bacterium]